MIFPKRISRTVERLGFFVLGLAAATTTAALAANSETLYARLNVLAQVLAHVENDYVHEMDPQTLIHGAARGVTDELDDYSQFYSPQEYRALQEDTEGEFAGLGLELEKQSDGLGFMILAAVPKSPAAKADLQAGDILQAVDGQSTTGLDYDALVRMLRGPVGSTVKLLVKKARAHKSWEFNLVRSWVRVPALSFRMLPRRVAYVHLSLFPRGIAADLESVLAKKKISAMILDLRGNPGGLFDEAVEVCDLFLEGGPIVSVKMKSGAKLENREARKMARFAKLPIAILIDTQSASASEIVAGALGDRKRARLFGTKSFGKGSVQTMWDLADGSGLKLTIAHYFTPSGRLIDGHGIEADEVILDEVPVADRGDLSTDGVAAAAIRWLRR